MAGSAPQEVRSKNALGKDVVALASFTVLARIIICIPFPKFGSILPIYLLLGVCAVVPYGTCKCIN
jgi:hypothetical protein